jgi:hypothetical protein
LKQKKGPSNIKSQLIWFALGRTFFSVIVSIKKKHKLTRTRHNHIGRWHILFFDYGLKRLKILEE